MAETRTCPKCNGRLVPGRIMEFNEFSSRNRYMYVWAADGEASPDLSKVLSGEGQSVSRKGLAAFCCDQCGFVEFYGVTAS